MKEPMFSPVTVVCPPIALDLLLVWQTPSQPTYDTFAGLETANGALVAVRSKLYTHVSTKKSGKTCVAHRRKTKTRLEWLLPSKTGLTKDVFSAISFFRIIIQLQADLVSYYARFAATLESGAYVRSRPSLSLLITVYC